MSPVARIRKFFITRALGKQKAKRPSMRPMGRTGEARYSPQIRTRQKGGGRTVVYAHRYDRISYRDYDRVRFYPAVVDALGAISGPVARANFHFSCARPEIADLAGELIGPKLRILIQQLVRGGLAFGHQTAEIIWEVLTDYTSTSGQSVQGGADVTYPFAYGVRSFKFFDPSDTYLQIFTDNGAFAGIRQTVTAENQEIRWTKLVHWVHEPEFDTLHGIPRTKAIVPWVDAAESVVDDMVLYSDRFAVPWTIGRHPNVSRVNSDGEDVDSVDDIHSIMESLGSAGYASLPSDIHMSADGTGSSVPKWDITIEQAPGEDRYVEKLQYLNDVVRLGMVVPEMASGSSPETGTYNLGETQIDLFLSNIEGILDSIAATINDQLMRRWVDYNFGADAPDCTLVFEPVDIKVKHALLGALLKLIEAGQPIVDQEGNQYDVDWAKLAEDSGIALHRVDPAGVARDLKQQILEKLAGGAMQPNTAQLSEHDESKHPRDSNGKFASKGGGSGADNPSTDVESFVESAQSDSTHREQISVGSTTERSQEAISSALGIPKLEWGITLSSDRVRHILKEHGNETGGQVSVTPSDFDHIEDVVNNHDSLKAVAAAQDGSPQVEFSKRYNGKTLVVLAVYSASNRKPDGELKVSSMYKHKTKGAGQ